ncbi:MAG TPA: hypothetical protein VHB02_07060 [Acidimicrobiales bacterium]|nr:hypothetical protein [Acidimicrobiales bacterium]
MTSSSAEPASIVEPGVEPIPIVDTTDLLLVAHQRIGELEATIVQRDSAIRELRRRLHELEQPFWERRSRLEEELDEARRQADNLQLVLGEAQGTARPDDLEREIAALKATRTFRYTAAARSLYAKLRLGR